MLHINLITHVCVINTHFFVPEELAKKKLRWDIIGAVKQHFALFVLQD